MKKLYYTLSLVFACAACAQAQSSPVPNANEEAVKNYDGTSGHFEYALNDRERVTVSYALAPKHPVNAAHFSIHTPDPMPFSAIVVDASGKTVYKWKPAQKTYFYQAEWDLVGLKSGAYTVKIFLENSQQSVNEFQFTKD